MRLPIYQVDAFTDKLFSGNPAAICPLPSWLPDATMQAIAAENNLAETAFFVNGSDGYLLRWFTPTVEVDLCGHATLASAHIVFNVLEPRRESVDFRTVKAGTLTVARRGDMLVMDFPARAPRPADLRPDCWRPWAASRARCCAPAIVWWSMAAPLRSQPLRRTLPRLPRWIAGPR